MNDDELLRRLAEAAREEERAERGRLDPRWDELAAGRLSEEDAAALRREAGESVAASRALEAFSPLGDDFRARVVRAAREQLGPEGTPAAARSGADPLWTEGIEDDGESGEADGRTPAAATAGPPAPAPPPPRAAPPERTPWAFRREPSDGGAARWAAAAILAAAVLGALFWPEADPAPLPDYQAALLGEVRTERDPGGGSGAPEGPETILFAPGNRFELVLRPETAVEGEIEVGTFREAGGRLVRWPLPVETAAGGSVRIAATVGRELELPDAGRTLVVVLGRPGRLPAADEVLAGLGGGSAAAPGWRAWRWRLAPAPAEL